mgnify:CR=1 FL=1
MEELAKEPVSPGTALLDAIKSMQPAKITNADREADKKEIAKLQADVDLLKRSVSHNNNRIRSMRSEIQALQAAVGALQRQARPAVRGTPPARKRDGLDHALERELYD